MRDGLTILDRTRMRTETIAEAMVSVMAFMEPERMGWRDEDGCKAEVDTIEAMHGDLKAEMAQALRFIQHHWNEIIVNEMRLQEVETFLAECKRFQDIVRRFDECFCKNEKLSMELFTDWWISRAYLMAIAAWTRQAEYLETVVSERFRPWEPKKKEFRNVARRFGAYFVGVKDRDLEELMRSGRALPQRPRWIGSRCEAVVFGRYFGLSCKQMNDAFLFLDKDMNPSKLNYSQDAPRMDDRLYDIYKLCTVAKSLL